MFQWLLDACLISISCARKSLKKVDVRYQHTKKILSALARLALVFFLPRVISFSASRCASLALGQVVFMDSWVMREVTRLRRRAWR